MVVKCTSLRLHRCPCNCWHCDSLTKSVLLQELSLPRLPHLRVFHCNAMYGFDKDSYILCKFRKAAGKFSGLDGQA